MGETSKARARRASWIGRYTQGRGVDVGCGDDPLTEDCERWEIERGPLTGKYDWVYSSHCLEHITHPRAALRRWWSCIRPGGYLILSVPHRDRYEGRMELPSHWNPDHKSFWLPDRFVGPCTHSLLHAVWAACPGAETLRLTVEDEGWSPPLPGQHPPGEYSIEGVWRKPR